MVGSLVSNANPEFDPRKYGKKKLGDLIKMQNYVEVKSKQFSDGSPTSMVFVRLKEP